MSFAKCGHMLSCWRAESDIVIESVLISAMHIHAPQIAARPSWGPTATGFGGSCLIHEFEHILEQNGTEGMVTERRLGHVGTFSTTSTICSLVQITTYTRGHALRASSVGALFQWCRTNPICSKDLPAKNGVQDVIHTTGFLL